MSRRERPFAPREEQVVWHDVECAAYEADLELWLGLAEDRGGPLLDLGAGTGRVALLLAERGHDVTALDADRPLVETLAARARERGLHVATHTVDIRSFELPGRRFALAIAPMQVFQLLGGVAGRESALRAVRAVLDDGGLLAVALADPFEGIASEDALPPLPDVREQDGWVFQSAPIALRAGADHTAIERLRQAVSPEGALHESMAVIRLDTVSPEQLEHEAAANGYNAIAREHVPETEAYVGSAVALLEAR